MEHPVVQALLEVSLPPPLKETRDLVTVASPRRKAHGDFMCAVSTRPPSPLHLELRHFGMAGDRAVCDGDT